MTKEAAQGATELPPPGVAAVESSLDRTQILLAEFRDEVAHLLAKVHRDVEKLREATLGQPGLVPRADPAFADEAQAERSLAEAVGEEQAMLRTRTLVNEVIDERFRQLHELIHQARMRQSVSSLQKQRLGASRRKP